jgi:alpha/beta superfamily hydrolase
VRVGLAEQPATVDVAGAVTLEARVAVPPGATAGVVVCHPHPLYGGDMDNGVVVRAVEACAARNLATLRFNFRGVGASSGTHDDGRSEQDDARAALADLTRRLPAGATVALAGYSFGAAVAAAVAEGTPLAGLALIAPPLRVMPVATAPAGRGPVLIVVGAEDQYCPAEALDTLQVALPQATITVIEGADHFFFGALDPLGVALGDWATALRT